MFGTERRGDAALDIILERAAPLQFRVVEKVIKTRVLALPAIPIKFRVVSVGKGFNFGEQCVSREVVYGLVPISRYAEREGLEQSARAGVLVRLGFATSDRHERRVFQPVG